MDTDYALSDKLEFIKKATLLELKEISNIEKTFFDLIDEIPTVIFSGFSENQKDFLRHYQGSIKKCSKKVFQIIRRLTSELEEAQCELVKKENII